MINKASSMEACPPYSSKRKDDSEFNLREWALKKAQNNYGEKTKSRRHSASYIRSFNEETKSFRSSNITFSSATSSPAYPFKDHGIDPSTYSFNSAIKALQARSCYNSWECLSPDGFALNSKWNEAEKYICNPLSGEVPIECLSSKALISGRSFRKSISNNKVITIISEDHDDDPLVYSLRNAQTKTSSSSTYYTQEEDDHDHEALQYFPTIPEKKKEGMTRDVGIQSTSPYVSSSSPSPASTPSIIERSIKQVGDSSPNSNAKTKSEEEEEEEGEEKDKETETEAEKMDDETLEKKEEQFCREGGGCFPWMKKIKLKEKGRRRKINIFLTHC